MQSCHRAEEWRHCLGETATHEQGAVRTNSAPRTRPGATIAMSKRRVIVRTRLRRRANGDGAAPVAHRASCCGGGALVRARGGPRLASSRRRRVNISGPTRLASTARSAGRSAAARHRGSTDRNGRRQRRWRRHVRRLRAFEHDGGSKHDCASAQKQQRVPSNFLVGIMILLEDILSSLIDDIV